MQVSIELPSSFVIFESVAQIQQDMALSYALMLFKMGKVSLAKAADVAGISIYALMRECKKNHISVMDTSIDLQSELVGL
jgi:predicted HTH domain antitoxin